MARNTPVLTQRTLREMFHYTTLEDGHKFTTGADHAFSIKHAIINNTQSNVYVATTALGCVKIPPSGRDYGNANQDVIIEVTIDVPDIDIIKNFQDIHASTPLDEVLKAIIIYEISLLKDNNINSFFTNGKVQFRLPLSHIKRSVGDHGFYSEILGIYISLKTDSGDSFLTSLPIAMLPKHIETDISDVNYQALVVVDNENKIDNIWTMIGGEPVQIRKHAIRGFSSGLYIISNKTNGVGVKVEFIHADDLYHEKLLSEKGYAFSRDALMAMNHTKEYILLKEKEAKYNELLKDHKALDSAYSKVVKEKESLEGKMTSAIEAKEKEYQAWYAAEAKKLDDEHNRLLKEQKAMADTVLKNHVYDHNREVRELRIEIERGKRALADQKSYVTERKNSTAQSVTMGTAIIAGIVAIGKFIMDMFKSRKTAKS